MSRMLNYSIIKGQVYCSKTKRVERQEFTTKGEYLRSCDPKWLLKPCTGDHWLVHKGEQM